MVTKMNKSELVKYEESEKISLIEALKFLTQEQVSKVQDLRKKCPLDAIDIVSSNIDRNKNISNKIKTDLSLLHSKFNILINEVASTLEDASYKETKNIIDHMNLSYKDKTKSNLLIEADKKRLISIRSLNLTIEIFNEFNKNIEKELDNAINTKNINSEKNLLLINAIIFYELTDFLIKYINNFKINGIDELKRVYHLATIEIDNLKSNIGKLKNILHDQNVLQSEKDKVREQINTSEKAIQILENEWNKIFGENDKFQGEVDKIINLLPTLESMKIRAETQLSLLESISMLQLVKNSIGSFQNAFSSLSGIKLIPLEPERVKRLLNIG